MAGIGRLLEILREENKGPQQLYQSLRSDAAGPGLRSFLSILRRGIGSDADGKPEVQCWSRPQIEATLSVAKLIASSSVAAPVKHAEPAVLAIIESSLELCTHLLERWKFGGDDISFQFCILEVLEVALADGKDFEPCKHLLNVVEESLPTTADLGLVELNTYAKCNTQGVDCLMKKKPVDRVLVALAAESLQPDYPATVFTQYQLPKSPNSVMSLSQHWAVVHVKCLPRLLTLAKEFLIPPSSCRDLTVDVCFSSNLSLSLRILKLLVSLTKDAPAVVFDVDLLHTVSCFVNALPALFKLEFELECEASSALNSFVGLLLNLLEEFLQFVHIAFCNGVIFQNVRTCIIASILGTLDSNFWRSNRLSSSLKAPVIYCPQIVMHILKLIQNVKNETSQILNWKEKLDMDLQDTFSGSESCTFSCNENVYLLRHYTCEEHLRIIFPLSRQWVDDLVHLVLFLHSEGVRLRLKGDRLRPTCTKSAVSDMESVTSHEDEAIFGDLFSEAIRPAGSSDGHEQPPVTTCGLSSGQNMPIIAATELLNFLKLCIFSPDWHHTIYDDACKKLREHHIDGLLSILHCQYCVDDKASQINCALSSQRIFGHVNEICFELLHNLLVRRALPGFLGRSGGTIVVFDIDCEPLTTIPGKAIKGTPEIQHSELVMSEGLLDSTSTNGPTVASQHSFSHGHSDANFYERASLSGHISSGGTIVAFDIDSEPVTTIPDKDSKGTSEIQQSELVMSGGLLESTTSDGPTVASQPSFGHGHSDANFPGQTSLSSRIAYSGQIPYSGSISLRSDNSTTSIRSFAFPILQSEWNTSPVRMAKADRRHLKRRRGWRSGLLCCRF